MSKRSKFWLCLALVLCLVGGLVAGLVQTSYGQVTITDVVIETDSGRFTGYLLVPKTATKDNPAPAIVTSHGYLNHREMQDLNYVELSRRGFVVFAMDAYGHGDSQVAGAGASDISKATGGMVDAVEYVSKLNFVDPEKIGVTGHSMGGGYSDKTTNYYTSLELEALEKGFSPEEAAKLNKVAAALIVGNVPSNLASVAPYRAEVGVIAGEYDEFFIVTVGDSLAGFFSHPTIKGLATLQAGTAIPEGALEEGKRYENPETGYGITFWRPREIHPWNHFSKTSCGYGIEFFTQALGAPNPIDSGNQIWQLKEAFNLVGLIGFFLLMVPLCDALLSLPFFADLKAKEAPAPIKLEKKGRYFALSAVNSILGGILIIPLIAVGFLGLVNPFWPQDTTGGIGLWGTGCGLLGLLFLRLGGSRIIKDAEGCGTKISLKALGKTVLLAICVAVLMFATVFMSDWLFKTDFRIWSFCIRAFSPEKVWVAIKYLPLFLVYYIVNAISVNRSRFEGWSEGKQIAYSILWNILGVCLFLMLQYLPLLFTGKTFLGTIFTGILATAGALFPILVFPFVPILSIVAVTAIKLYRRTGNAYLPGILNALVVTMITIAGTSFSHPY